ncbi:MAG: class I adenylate-forming enzyme family protein [Vulcanimicrobiaceae bacterium]
MNIHRSLPAALAGWASSRPAALALDDLSYAELSVRVLRTAGRLRELGVSPGDRVAIYSENRHGFVFAYLGALAAGAIVVPINVLYRSAELEWLFADAAPRLICRSPASAQFLGAGGGIAQLDLAQLEAETETGAMPAGDALPALDPDAVAILIYTSGTTGRSKGAMLTHRNLATIAAQLNEAWRWSAADTLYLALPLFHVHGLGAGLGGTLAAGARLRLRARFDAADALATLGRGEATMFFGVPTMYVRLLESASEKIRLPQVRLFVSGSAALPASVWEAFAARFGSEILERYGATEFGFALSNRYDGPRFPGSVGFPLPEVEVRLVDGKGRELPAGEIGELLVRGPNLFAGYWRNDAATQAAFHTDSDGSRWYRSGDLAAFDPERGYSIAGRIKELIITGGFNVYPIEVEEELMRIPGIRAAALVGKPDAARGELPVAFVEADAPFDAEAATATLQTRLASFKVPKAIVCLDALPRNAMGKIERQRLRAGLEASEAKE